MAQIGIMIEGQWGLTWERLREIGIAHNPPHFHKS